MDPEEFVMQTEGMTQAMIKEVHKIPAISIKLERA
jgi:hypothetical protein